MDLDRSRPVWKQVAQVIRDRIDDGTYPPGGRIPSVTELAAEFDIATSTAAKALAALRREEVIRGEVGIGTFVA